MVVFYLSIIAVTICLSFCKNLKKDEVGKSVVENHQCIAVIIKEDARLGKTRNHATELTPLTDVINQYIEAVLQLDYTNCPEIFKIDMTKHLKAWAAVTEITDSYPEIRGEMHDLFDQIKTSKDSSRFSYLVDQIWTSWDSVESHIN